MKATRQPDGPAIPSAAHFLRGASGFGAVVFREQPRQAPALVAKPDPTEGHTDCLFLHAASTGWAWHDPRHATRRLECER